MKVTAPVPGAQTHIRCSCQSCSIPTHGNFYFVQKSDENRRAACQKTWNLVHVLQHTVSRFVVFMFFGCFSVCGRVIAYYCDKKYNPCLGFVIKSQAVLSKSVCNSTESDQKQNLEGLTHQLYTFAVCFLRSNFNLLEKKKKKDFWFLCRLHFLAWYILSIVCIMPQ